MPLVKNIEEYLYGKHRIDVTGELWWVNT